MRLPAWCTTAALTVAMTLCGAGGAVAADTAAVKVERYLADLSSWSADFAQTLTDSSGKTLRTASGHLYLQRPGRFRWDYQKPAEQLIVADGRKLWFYDKDLQQANVRDMDASLANTPAALLTGGAALGSQFDISALPPADGLEWFQLVPKHADTDFIGVRVGFAKGELVRMLLADKLNQVTALAFSAAHRNATLSPDLFSFTPPAGVDVIGNAP
jgi:outer membrane lipoprotein carrier protein